MTRTAFDQARAEQFGGRMVADGAAVMSTALAHIGDRLGLWKDLAKLGPATSAALATRTGLSERHVREWLACMASAGYIAYEPASGQFQLPPEHAAALADEGGPMFMGGAHQFIFGCLGQLDRVVDTFQHGGGVPLSAYPDGAFEGMGRLSATWSENLLVQAWVAIAGVEQRLAEGIDVADIGCGHGNALVRLAQAFPRSRYTGFDVHGANVARAAEAAARAGVGDRVRFAELDASAGVPGAYDLVTTFDVVHDAVDPLGLLRAIRGSLRPHGVYLCLDIHCADRLEENSGPLGTLMFGMSVLYCMTTSLAHGGAGLGTCGLPEPKLRELAALAGFAEVEKLPIENPFNDLYRLR